MLSNNYFINMVNMDGQLDAAQVSHMETIYTTRSGQDIIRFIYQDKSYIYKPCSMEAVSRELWAQQHLLPHLTTVKAPLILATGKSSDPEIDWMIYEDLGVLVHCTDIDELIRAAGMIPAWHQLPTSIVPEGMKGHSPHYSEVMETISKDNYRYKILSACHINQSILSKWWELLRSWERYIQTHQVVSHGDYYRLNIALQNEQCMVIDWEFAHVNSVYWDLYSLMDITSYRYRRIPVNRLDREAALYQYWLGQKFASPTDQLSDFIYGYYVFASVYSAWILTLIDEDIRHNRAPIDALRVQQDDTRQVFEQCVQAILEIDDEVTPR